MRVSESPLMGGVPAGVGLVQLRSPTLGLSPGWFDGVVKYGYVVLGARVQAARLPERCAPRCVRLGVRLVRQALRAPPSFPSALRAPSFCQLA